MSDRELRERYEREKEHFRRPERAQVREIIIAPKNETAAALSDASARAVQIAARAKQGDDFAALAKEFSDAPTKESGGSLGEVAKGELLSTLDTAIFSAEPNSVIGPIQTRAGFHIMKVEAKLPSELPSFESVKEQLRKDASDETFQRDYKAYIERLRKEAFLQIYEENVPKG
jgi:parvulin-like peptidyl-prolyl isomerase